MEKKYYIKIDACSGNDMFGICGQPCLKAGDGVIKKGGEFVFFAQTTLLPHEEAAIECARKVCPAGAIRVDETPDPEPDEDEEF